MCILVGFECLRPGFLCSILLQEFSLVNSSRKVSTLRQQSKHLLACLNLPWKMNTGSGVAKETCSSLMEIPHTGGVSIPENIQKPSRHGPGHPAPGGLFCAGEIGPGDLKRPLQTWASLWSSLASKRREGMLPCCESAAGRGAAEQRRAGAICNHQHILGGGVAKVWKMKLDVPKWDEEFVLVTKTWAWVHCQTEITSCVLDWLSSIQTTFPCYLLASRWITGCCAKFHLFLCG